MELRQKAQIISNKLEQFLGVPKWDGTEDVLECLILTILSQNTTDVSRDKGYAQLRKKYPTWEQVLRARNKSIEDQIRIVGLGKQKADTIKNFLTWLNKEYCFHNSDPCSLSIKWILKKPWNYFVNIKVLG